MLKVTVARIVVVFIVLNTLRFGSAAAFMLWSQRIGHPRVARFRVNNSSRIRLSQRGEKRKQEFTGREVAVRRVFAREKALSCGDLNHWNGVVLTTPALRFGVIMEHDICRISVEMEPITGVFRGFEGRLWR